VLQFDIKKFKATPLFVFNIYLEYSTSNIADISYTLYHHKKNLQLGKQSKSNFIKN